MSAAGKGVEFYVVRSQLAPPYTQDGPSIYGRSGQGLIAHAAYMHDYYSVSAEEQRRMAENTIALCELLYSQEVANDQMV